VDLTARDHQSRKSIRNQDGKHISPTMIAEAADALTCTYEASGCMLPTTHYELLNITVGIVHVDASESGSKVLV
jgi:hypothetical protein